MSVKLAVTGRPGVGKTTLCLKVYRALRERGVECSGFVTKEVRKGGRRVGFEVIDLESGKSFTLASVSDCSSGRKVGKYCVNVEEFESYVVDLERIALDSGDKRDDSRTIIIIDEVGPMELKSKRFAEFVRKLVNGSSDVLFSIHMRSNHPVLREIRSRFRVYTIDEKNRDRVAEEIIEVMTSR